jgi:hypothetical protein
MPGGADLSAGPSEPVDDSELPSLFGSTLASDDAVSFGGPFD